MKRKNNVLAASLLVMLLWGLLFPAVKLGYRAFGIASVAGCVLQLSRTAPMAKDLLACAACLGTGICGVMLFSRRKELEMLQEENPEKRQAGKHKAE